METNQLFKSQRMEPKASDSMIKFYKNDIKTPVPVGQMVYISYDLSKLIICPQAVRDFSLQRDKYVNIYHQEHGFDIGIKPISDKEDPEAYRLIGDKLAPGAVAIACPEFLHSNNRLWLDCRGVWFHASWDPNNQMVLVHTERPMMGKR